MIVLSDMLYLLTEQLIDILKTQLLITCFHYALPAQKALKISRFENELDSCLSRIANVVLN